MNQFYRASKRTSTAALLGLCGLGCWGSIASAQSAAALATSPYVPIPPAIQPAAPACACPARRSVEPAVVPAKPVVEPDHTVKSGNLTLPIVVFRGTPAAPLAKPAAASLTPVQTGLTPAPAPAPAPASAPAPAPVQVALPLSPPVSPPQSTEPKPAAKSTPVKPAGPFKRIWRDTKKSVVEDIPEALADALPWVDRGQKDEPIEQVLARVSQDLSRASAEDPEWINPAESELRELSKRLATLAAPPVEGSVGSAAVPSAEMAATDRPFRPRPIWPGATGRPETQSRPTAIVTGSTIQPGPEAAGQRLPPPLDWVEEEEKAAKPPPQQVVAKRAKRPSK